MCISRAVYANNPEILKLLLENGANATLPSLEKLEALHVASHFGRVYIARLLLDHGADPNALDQRNETPLKKLLIQQEKKDVKLVKLLLDKGAKDLHLEESKAWEEILHEAILAKDKSISQSLLKHKQDFNVDNDFGRTYLTTAVTAGNVEAVQLLLAHGAALGRDVDQQQNLLTMARQHPNIEALLKEAMNK